MMKIEDLSTTHDTIIPADAVDADAVYCSASWTCRKRQVAPVLIGARQSARWRYDRACVLESGNRRRDSETDLRAKMGVCFSLASSNTN
jgi:hypothetical protein